MATAMMNTPPGGGGGGGGGGGRQHGIRIDVSPPTPQYEYMHTRNDHIHFSNYPKRSHKVRI